jgi:hypothetical protein
MPFTYTSPTQEEQDALNALRTFYQYVVGWTLCSGSLSDLKDAQARLPAFAQLQGGSTTDTFKESYWRGLLTLKAMEALPIETNESLALTANFWAPVQAYYACHGFGLATLAGLNAGTPKRHRQFLSSFSQHVAKRLFPYPYNVVCAGNPLVRTSGAWNFDNCQVTPNEVTSFSNLSNPNATNAHLIIGKCLLTTRKKFLKTLFTEQRSSTRRNLSHGRKHQLAMAYHGTSVADFLYRMRMRSNYEDPGMFMMRTDLTSAINRYRALVHLVQTFRHLCDNILSLKVGTRNWSLFSTHCSSQN